MLCVAVMFGEPKSRTSTFGQSGALAEQGKTRREAGFFRIR
jgi:hypothetical protein